MPIAFPNADKLIHKCVDPHRLSTQDVYAASKKLFSSLPLAATVQGSTIIMHGGKVASALHRENLA